MAGNHFKKLKDTCTMPKFEQDFEKCDARNDAGSTVAGNQNYNFHRLTCAIEPGKH